MRQLEAASASARMIATARLHRDGILRLAQVRDADRRALAELEQPLEALSAQIVLARALGSSGDGSADIVSDLWARVEGLGVAFDAHSTAAGRVEAAPALRAVE